MQKGLSQLDQLETPFGGHIKKPTRNPMVSIGKPGRRIFVHREGIDYAVPYWISKKGNLCWKLEDRIYVKMRGGFTMMLKDGLWIPADARTKATVGQE